MSATLVTAPPIPVHKALRALERKYTEALLRIEVLEKKNKKKSIELTKLKRLLKENNVQIN